MAFQRHINHYGEAFYSRDYEQPKIFRFTEGWNNPYHQECNFVKYSTLNPADNVKIYDVYLSGGETEENIYRFGKQVSLMVRFLDSLGVKRPVFYSNQRQGVIVLEDKDNPNSVHYYGYDGWLVMVVNNEIIDLRDYFSVWTRPTKEELDYLEMVCNIKLNWSDKKPFPVLYEINPIYADVKYDWKF